MRKSMIASGTLVSCVFISLVIFVGLKFVNQGDPLQDLPQERLEALWAGPEQVSVNDLYSACFTMVRAGDWERAAVFYWSAEVRRNYERMLYPPKKEGGNDPLLVYLAMGSVVEADLMSNLYAHPESHRAAVDRFRSYTPKVAWWYIPFWSHKKGMPKPEAFENAQKMVNSITDSSEEILELTAIPEYLENLKVWNDIADRSQGRATRFRAANRKMWSIEEKTGIRSGLVFPVSEPNQSEDRQ